MQSIVVSENICLESISMSMAQLIFETIDRDRDYLKVWLPFVEMTHQVSDTENFIKGLLDQAEKKRDQIFCIWFKHEFAGLIGLKDTDWINKKTEIGYWLAENKQGNGIVSLSVRKLSKYAFQKLKLNRIQIKVAEGNLKSIAIPQRMGFQYEGIERAGELHNNGYLDIKVFSLLKTD